MAAQHSGENTELGVQNLDQVLVLLLIVQGSLTLICKIEGIITSFMKSLEFKGAVHRKSLFRYLVL